MLRSFQVLLILGGGILPPEVVVLIARLRIDQANADQKLWMGNGAAKTVALTTVNCVVAPPIREPAQARPENKTISP